MAAGNKELKYWLFSSTLSFHLYINYVCFLLLSRRKLFTFCILHLRKLKYSETVWHEKSRRVPKWQSLTLGPKVLISMCYSFACDPLFHLSFIKLFIWDWNINFSACFFNQAKYNLGLHICIKYKWCLIVSGWKVQILIYSVYSIDVVPMTCVPHGCR